MLLKHVAYYISMQFKNAWSKSFHSWYKTHRSKQDRNSEVTRNKTCISLKILLQNIKVVLCVVRTNLGNSLKEYWSALCPSASIFGKLDLTLGNQM
jgi:hypothetical protein